MLVAARGVGWFGRPSAHPNTYRGASVERSEGCTDETGDGPCSAGASECLCPFQSWFVLACGWCRGLARGPPRSPSSRQREGCRGALLGQALFLHVVVGRTSQVGSLGGYEEQSLESRNENQIISHKAKDKCSFGSVSLKALNSELGMKHPGCCK